MTEWPHLRLSSGPRSDDNDPRRIEAQLALWPAHISSLVINSQGPSAGWRWFVIKPGPSRGTDSLPRKGIYHCTVIRQGHYCFCPPPSPSSPCLYGTHNLLLFVSFPCSVFPLPLSSFPFSCLLSSFILML